MSPENDTPQNNDDHEQDTIELSNGRSVPKSAVDALRVLDEKWPGATLRIARPAIVAAVLDALHVDGFFNEHGSMGNPHADVERRPLGLLDRRPKQRHPG